MRRIYAMVTVFGMVVAMAAPAVATARVRLDGPSPAIWLSDPDGVDGVAGIEQGDAIDGARGRATVFDGGARIRVRAPGLEPGHAYTMWVVYFNDSTLCVDGCNGADLGAAGGGVIWGAGTVARPNGTAVFRARLADGAGAGSVGDTSPPPFAFAEYASGANNEFHIVIRSHGPVIPGELAAQLTEFGGGCTVNVGPAPEEIGDFPVPLAEGECGDVQLYVFR